MTGNQQKDVLICGWYGTETLGDKAILGGVIESIREVVPDAAIDVASLEPYVTYATARQMPELGLDEILSLEEAKRAVRRGRYRSVVIGGGPLMSPVRQCIDLLELFSEARLNGTKTIVAGCGIGPLSVQHINRAIAGILNLADAVLVRDSSSAQLARERLGYAGAVEVILDPAFCWLQRNRVPRPREDFVLLALREWNPKEYARGLPRLEAVRVIDALEQQLQWFVDTVTKLAPKLEIVPFCMHKLAVGGDDRMYYRRLFRDYPKILRNLDDRHRSPAEDLALYTRARAVLAMRFHSVVFSVATETPFIAIDYTLGGKTAGLLQDLNRDGGEIGRLIPLCDFDGRVAAREMLDVKPFPSVQSQIERTRTALRDTFSRLLPT